MRILLAILLSLASSSHQQNITNFNIQSGEYFATISPKCQDAMGRKHHGDLLKCENSFWYDMKVKVLIHGNDWGLVVKDACCSLDSILKCYEMLMADCSPSEISSITKEYWIKFENEFFKQYGLSMKCQTKDHNICSDKMPELSPECHHSIDNSINDIYGCDYGFVRNFRRKNHGQSNNPHMDACCAIKQNWYCLDTIKDDCDHDELEIIQDGNSGLVQILLKKAYKMNLKCYGIDIDMCNHGIQTKMSVVLLLLLVVNMIVFV